MKIENNNINVPQCFDEKFFIEAIQRGFGENDIEIKQITFSMGSNAGENYCSDIYRVKVIFTRENGELERVSLIIKSMPLAESNACLRSLRVFAKEKVMYFEVLPEIEGLLKGVKVAPRCYYSKSKPINSIVFEDLKTLGYVTQDREVGLDEEHGKIVLRKLAKYHAASMVLAKQRPEILVDFDIGFFNTNEPNFFENLKMYENNFTYLTKITHNWPGFNKVIDKIHRIDGNFIERVVTKSKDRTSKWNVLNHGDLWLNNMMFRYEDGAVSDVLFVDFQISIFHSLGIDLNYFMHTSLKFDVLKNKWFDLITEYHDALVSALQDLGVTEIPTLDDIRDEIRQMNYYALFAVVGVFPVACMKREACSENSLETLTQAKDGDAKQVVMFESERVLKTLEYSLQYLEKQGAFDKLLEIEINK